MAVGVSLGVGQVDSAAGEADKQGVSEGVVEVVARRVGLKEKEQPAEQCTGGEGEGVVAATKGVGWSGCEVGTAAGDSAGCEGVRGGCDGVES